MIYLIQVHTAIKKMSNLVEWASGPVLILLAGKMPAPQESLGYFFIWKSLILINLDNL